MLLSLKKFLGFGLVGGGDGQSSRLWHVLTAFKLAACYLEIDESFQTDLL